MPQRKREFPLGSVSEATLNIEHLLPAAASELDWLLDNVDELAGVDVSSEWKEEARRLLREWDREDLDIEEQEDLFDEIFDSLNEAAPPFVFFGGHPDDPASIGWWPSIDTLEEAARYGDVLKLDAGESPPSDYRGYVMIVDDHGGVIFGYHDKGEFTPYWSIV
jgi:hypothetical protein